MRTYFPSLSGKFRKPGLD